MILKINVVDSCRSDAYDEISLAFFLFISIAYFLSFRSKWVNLICLFVCVCLLPFFFRKKKKSGLMIL